jgi:small subunit ribosomal protein S17
MQQEKSRQKEAVVIGRIGNKSIKVAIEYALRHPKYGKLMRRRTVLGVHDELNKAAVGDVVGIAQCRPYSKLKKWRLVNVIKKAVAR